MKPKSILWCAVFATACANVASPSSQATEQLEHARELLVQDPDGALAITDALLRDYPAWRDARLVAAEGSLQLATTGATSSTELLLQDARRNYERALDGDGAEDRPDAWLQLARVQTQLGDDEAASESAQRAAQQFKARKTMAASREAAAAQLVAADADFRRFVALRQPEIESGTKDKDGRVAPGRPAIELASVAAARYAEIREEYPVQATTKVAELHQWLGQDGEATKEYERGIVAFPQENALHDAYIQWMARCGEQDALVGAYSTFVRQRPAENLVRWYQSRALFARADQLRGEGNFRGAIAAYGKAHQNFADYEARVPAHADATNQWLALCDLSIARTEVDAGDLTAAAEHLFAAGAISPATTAEVAGKPQLVDSFGAYYAGVAFAIHRAHAERGDDHLRETLAFNEAVLQHDPDRWGFVYNNAALAARDLGVKLAQDGDETAAKELWERSYGYYEKAVALSPDDARIVNDCGLMLIYHLARDFDHARALFDRAIQVGQAQLDAMPADADADERQRVEEAVGDAWQNIAMLARDHLHEPFASYRQYCEESVKFYPYQRREAAALLRNGGADQPQSTARGTANATLAPQAGGPQGGAAEAFAKVEKLARSRADSGNYDEALTDLDGIAKECASYAPYHALRGDLTLKLAMQARDARRRGADLLFTDAATILKKAVELDGEPNGPRLLLGQALYETGDVAGAANAASSLLLHIQSKGGADDATLAAHKLRASAGARAFIASVQEKKDDKDLLAAARVSFRVLEEKGQLDADGRKSWSDLEVWAGAPAEAVNVYARALAKNPDDQVLLAALVDTASAQKQLPLAIEALAKRDDATGLWYLGRAHYLAGCTKRMGSDAAGAQQELDAARGAFEKSMANNNAYRDSCEQWIAMTLGLKGNLALNSGDKAKAEELLMASLRMRPDRIGDDLSLGNTTKDGLIALADKFYQAKDLGKVEAIYRAAAGAASGDVDLQNNAGLFARDWGNALEKSGKVEAAKEMYEQSYKAYSRACQIDPKNVRLRNDCALIAIHHLDRDWDESKQLLDNAIADGERTLAEAPPEDKQAKQDLDEAVGDCYENLALWHLKHSKDAAAAKAAAEASQKHYPGARRPGAQKHLQDAAKLQQAK